MPGKHKRRNRARRGWGFGARCRQDSVHPTSSTLLDVGPGQSAWVAGFSNTISRQQAAHLQAYGLIPGQWVRVVQQSPVTVLLIDHLELALEHELADSIKVGKIGYRE